MSQSQRSGPPLVGALRNPVIRLFASLKFGVTLLFLVLAYACIFSALPQVRGALELTEMAAFSHWLFAILVYLLCTSVIIATLTRIRFCWENAGVLTVHTGLLLLCGGSIWYFGGKIEGDVLLSSPRIEMVTLTPPQRAVASVLVEKGQSWSNTMPAFGGQVGFEVLDAKVDGVKTRADVRYKIGDGEVKQATLLANRGMEAMSGQLALRLVAAGAVRTFYDAERPALYARKTGGANWSTTEIRGLPIHRERYLDEGYAVRDADEHAVPSKRNSPAISLGGLKIPTGWFESWRMPIRVPLRDAPFDVSITGYLPYIAGTKTAAAPGGSELFPAATVRLSSPHGEDSIQRTLFALDPATAWLPTEPPVEFRWASSPEERAAMLAPQSGADELTIEVKDPPVRKTVAIRAGDSIAVEGTSYELKIQQLFPSWPLRSPGFENAVSPAALVEVSSAEKKFTRTVIQRFPELSQDIDEKGMRRKEGPYDPNLVLTYRSVVGGRMLLVGDVDTLTSGKLTLGVFDLNGKVEQHALSAGAKDRILAGRFVLDFAVTEFLDKARRIEMPVVEPLERRRPNVSARGMSAIRLLIEGKGPAANWRQSEWCLFSLYPEDDERVLHIHPPGGEAWEIVYSRMAHDLGALLTPGRLSVDFFPGRQSVESWRSDFWVSDEDGRETHPAHVQTNRTASVGGWTLFQSGAANDHWSYTILGVGNRRGIWPMVLGCVMIVLGCLYAFYVKPVLRRRRAEAAATREADNDHRRGQRFEQTEVVEVRR
ncbi:MAG: hypothetical protein U1D55_03620 [Phycisphaerae bacterium]